MHFSRFVLRASQLLAAVAFLRAAPALYGLDLATGAVLSSPAFAGNTVLFGSTDGNLYALE
ncbi:MAG: hypothetical protein NVS9B14_06100 [Candidatus Acidiferrum sp.]